MKIEIPEKLWYICRGEERLAYVTHFAEDAAFQKRKETGTSWAYGYRGKDKENEPVITENALRTGYKIVDNVSRWSTSNVAWRILDPRGFEFEIYSGNMMEIIKCAEVKNGEIMTPCIFGRESGKNILLPEGSEPYEVAKKYTAKAKINIPITDICCGDVILLKNNQRYEYLGHYYYCWNEYNDQAGRWDLKTSEKKLHFMSDIVEGVDERNITTYANPTVLELNRPCVLEDLDWVDVTNKIIDEHQPYVNGAGQMHAVVESRPFEHRYELIPVGIEELNTPYDCWSNYSFIINDIYMHTKQSWVPNSRIGCISSSKVHFSAERSSLNVDSTIISANRWDGLPRAQFIKYNIPYDEINKVEKVTVIVDGKIRRLSSLG